MTELVTTTVTLYASAAFLERGEDRVDEKTYQVKKKTDFTFRMKSERNICLSMIFVREGNERRNTNNMNASVPQEK